MIVDGKQIAAEIYEETATLVRGLSRTPVMAAVTCVPNFETQKYLELKKRQAARVGITLEVIDLPITITTAEAIARVTEILPRVDGVVIQLPFPAHINREALLSAVPSEQDPDGFSYDEVHNSLCLPPVVGAIEEIAKRHELSFAGKQVVVLGQGRLVGAPAARFLRACGAFVTVYTAEDPHQVESLAAADIIVSGIGKPHFITADMVKEGVIIFDAGTSEDGGFVVGDVHPDVAQKAALFTPVPGGIGPITVAVLLRNLLNLIQNRKH